MEAKTLSDMEARPVVKTLTDTVAKNIGRKFEQDSAKWRPRNDALTDMLEEIEAENDL